MARVHHEGATLGDVLAVVKALQQPAVLQALLRLSEHDQDLKVRIDDETHVQIMQTFAEAIIKHIDNTREPTGVDTINVKPDGTIVVDGFEEPIELLRLRRTIANAARNLKRINAWNEDRPSELDPVRGRRNVRATRYIVSTWRSLEALTALLRGEEVSSPIQDALADQDDEEEEKPERSANRSSLAPHTAPDNTIAVHYDANDSDHGKVNADLIAKVWSNIRDILNHQEVGIEARASLELVKRRIELSSSVQIIKGPQIGGDRI